MELKVWLYGLLFATFIGATCFVPLILISYQKRKSYEIVLMFLISVGIGSLTGSGLLHLVPQAFGIDTDEKYTANNRYLYISTTIMLGIFVFFFIEKFLKIVILRHKHNKLKKKIKRDEMLPHDKLVIEEHIHEHHPKKSSSGGIAPIAWIILVSDIIHKFMDGLSVGASFTESYSNGISLSIAIFIEEIPHQLGEFAILLNAGMSNKVAIMCRIIGSLFIYGGLVIGIVVGENLNINEWIYAITGGLFIYIALADMMPELSAFSVEIEQMKLRESKSKHTKIHDFKLKIKLFMLQNLGIVFGFSTMFLLAIYGGVLENMFD